MPPTGRTAVDDFDPCRVADKVLHMPGHPAKLLGGTARTLKVDYYVLKRRLAPDGSHARPRRKSRMVRKAALVELPPLATAASTECTIELEDGKGARLHLR